MEMKNTPKLRFPGFTYPWEQRKLGEMASFSKGNGYFKSDLKSTGIPIILYGRLYTKYETVIEDIDTFADAKEGAVYSLGGEVIVPASGETAEDISIASVVQNPGVLLGGDLNIIRPIENLLPAFLALSISNGSSHREMSKRAQGKSVVHLHNEDLAQIDLKYPSVEEQSKITACINWIDTLITLHQRKLEHLKLKKKSLLQKLFPKEGEVYPELRFPGFTGPWEQCKLADVANIIMGQSPSSQNYTDNPNDDILVQGNADLIDGQVVPRLWTKEITKSIDEGNIIMTVRAPVGDVAKTAYKVVLGRGVAGIKGDEYIYQFLLKLKYNHYWRSLSSGSTFESINSNDIKNLIIDIPCDEERTKIGNLLRKTDSLINLYQRKLEHLKLLKKALLQQLFV